MECKTTYSRSSLRRQAFTLVEVMVTLAISSILFLAVASLSLYTGRSFAVLTNYVELDNASRTALDYLTTDVRQAQFLDSFTDSRLVFTDADGQPLTYNYDTSSKLLTRTRGGYTKVLLRECDELRFNMYQRNTVPGTFNLVPTTTAVTCKAIDVSWVCSRKVLGSRLTTESIQTARIVMRKQQD